MENGDAVNWDYSVEFTIRLLRSFLF